MRSVLPGHQRHDEAARADALTLTVKVADAEEVVQFISATAELVQTARRVPRMAVGEELGDQLQQALAEVDAAAQLLGVEDDTFPAHEAPATLV